MRRLLIALATTLAFATVADTASASTGSYCNQNIGAHGTCVHTGWHNNIVIIEARSTGSALARVWVSMNSSGAVGSAQGDSPCDGCWAQVAWNDPGPNGFPTTYNRNTFLSSFIGDFTFYS